MLFIPCGISGGSFAIASPPLFKQERLTLAAAVTSSHAALPKGHEGLSENAWTRTEKVAWHGRVQERKRVGWWKNVMRPLRSELLKNTALLLHFTQSLVFAPAWSHLQFR